MRVTLVPLDVSLGITSRSMLCVPRATLTDGHHACPVGARNCCDAATREHETL